MDAGKALPGIKIMLDKERTLRLSMRGVISFKKATGKDIMSMSEADWQGLDSEQFVHLLVAFLIDEDRTITFDALQDMVYLDRLPEISAAINKSMAQSMPEAPKDAAPLAPKPQS